MFAGRNFILSELRTNDASSLRLKLFVSWIFYVDEAIEFQ